MLIWGGTGPEAVCMLLVGFEVVSSGHATSESFLGLRGWACVRDLINLA